MTYSQLPDSWKIVLAEEFNKSYFKELQNFIEEERKSKVIYPAQGPSGGGKHLAGDAFR